MRNIFFIVVCSLALGVGGCKKYLEVDPKNQRPIATVNDVKAVLAGFLKVLKPGETVTFHSSIGDVMYFTPSYWSLFEFYSDNIHFKRDYNTYINTAGPANGPTEAKLILLNNFTIPTNIWVQHYKSIGFLNVLLEELVEASGDETVRQQLRNEMLVCRALYYYKLLQYYAPYKQQETGIPVYTGTKGPFAGISIARSTQTEVFKLIIDQLTEALNSSAPTDPNYNLFYRKVFINNLLAQVFWYKAESGAKESGDYTLARKYANDALAGIVLPATLTDYVNSLNGAYDYPIYQRWGGGSTFSELTYGQPNGQVTFRPHCAPDLYSLFDPNDFRFKSNILADTTIKRPVVTSPNNYTTAYTLFRPEEAYLIKVEATLKDPQGGTEAEARTLLNSFRRMRGVNSDYTGSNLAQEIVNERRREFCFHSDLRWVDMKRYGIGMVRDNMVMYGKNYTVTVEPNGYQFALPVPVDEELKLNPLMTPNPSWSEIIF
jgi:starch-binding outer membrane protein, SusD/RagB family